MKMIDFPPQQLPMSKKTKSWRKKCVDWGDGKTFFNYNPVRNSVLHKVINYDLINGKLHMEDLALILNPDSILAGFVPDKVQHYPIINSKLNVLRGEEAGRVFDYKVVITNPNSISEIENNKKEEIFQKLQELVADEAQSEEEYNKEIEKLNLYYTYEWLDFREIRANALLNHYWKEYNMPLLFNKGFMDALTVGEELYQCDIVGGEPVVYKINPIHIRVFKSGYSNRIEDADILILEDYWSPGKVIDYFYDSLTKKDLEYIENLPNHTGLSSSDSMSNIDERQSYIANYMVGDLITSQEGFFFDPSGDVTSSLLPYDLNGNLRVIRVFWKSRRKIKKVKSYDLNTGEEIYEFYPESYVINEALGEEEEIFYINEAWEGTKIGEDIYVNMRPRPILYNRLSNPSRCHFGIIGSIYNLNDDKPFSMVDMMKPYSYLYDVVHDRLNKLLSRNWGKIVTLDLSKVPAGWDIEKWLYYAKVNNLAVVDSFKEGNIGAATGKLAGAMNNASSGVIDAELSNSIQYNINLLEFIKTEMAEVAGISRQREGLISNRETVGGVERATLQSSHITEWLFLTHDDVKKRVLECFLETAKIAMKGNNKKFQYLLADNSMQIIEIDGDEFAESDYGLVVDTGSGIQQLNQKIEALAQAALQNQALTFSTIMKLYNSSSLAEKQRMVEKSELEMQERQAQAQQEQSKIQQQLIEANLQTQREERELKDSLNQRDNDTKIIIATMQALNNEAQEVVETEDRMSESEQRKLLEQLREFDSKMRLDREKFSFEKEKFKTESSIKREALKRKPTSTKK